MLLVAIVNVPPAIARAMLGEGTSCSIDYWISSRRLLGTTSSRTDLRGIVERRRSESRKPDEGPSTILEAGALDIQGCSTRPLGIRECQSVTTSRAVAWDDFPP